MHACEQNNALTSFYAERRFPAGKQKPHAPRVHGECVVRRGLPKRERSCRLAGERVDQSNQLCSPPFVLGPALQPLQRWVCDCTGAARSNHYRSGEGVC